MNNEHDARVESRSRRRSVWIRLTVDLENLETELTTSGDANQPTKPNLRLIKGGQEGNRDGTDP